MKTTLNKIRAFNPCGIKPNGDGILLGLRKLMHTLGKTGTDDEPITIIQFSIRMGYEMRFGVYVL